MISIGNAEISICLHSNASPVSGMFGLQNYYAFEILIQILLERIKVKLCPEISEVRFGFVLDRGTTDAIFVLGMITKRNITYEPDVYAYFINFQKPSDRVRRTKL